MTVVLRGLTWDHPRGYAPLEAASKRYLAERGLEVGWDKRSLKAFGDTPIDSLAGDYDLLIIDHPHVGIAARCDCIIPLDTYLAKETLAQLARESAGPSHRSYTYSGHQWALAVDAAVQVSSYRPDLLELALPETWQDVLRVAQALRNQGLSLAVPLSPTDATCSFLTLCAGFGQPIEEAGGFVAEKRAVQVLDYLKTLVQLAHPQSLDWNPIQLYEFMASHDEVAYCPLAFGYSNYARTNYRPSLLKFADIPGLKGGLLGGAGIAVSRRCSYPREAAAFAAWLCGEGVQRGLYVRAGGQPGNKLAWQDETNNQLCHNYFRDTLYTLEQAYVRPRDAGFVSFQEYAGERIHAFLKTDGDPLVCAKDLARAFERRRNKKGSKNVTRKLSSV